MSRWIICAIVLAWAVAGCGGAADDSSRAENLSSVQQAATSVLTCKKYDGYTAALAEATIECLGAIGPRDYATDPNGATGFLFPTFDSCPAEVFEPVPEHPKARRVPAMLRIRRLLSLQNEQAHPFSQLGIQCIRDAYLIAADGLLRSGVSVCPNWHKVFSGGVPTQRNIVAMKGRIPKPVLRAVKGEDKPAWVIDPPKPGSGFRFPKQYYFYTVSFDNQKVPPDQSCGSAVACARACSGLFEGFLVGRFGRYLVGDPYWWLDPTDYGGFDEFNDPYNRITGFYHPMSLAGDDVPGEIYGDFARAALEDTTPDPAPGQAELCTRWDGTDHRMARLVRDDLLPNADTWLSRCELYPAAEAPTF